MPKPNTDIKINMPGYTGPEETLFTSDSLPDIAPSSLPKKSPLKLIILLLVSATIFFGLGVLGYYYIYPKLFPATITINSNNNSPIPLTPPIAPNPNNTPPTETGDSHRSLVSSDGSNFAPSLEEAKSSLTREKGNILFEEVVLKNADGTNITFDKYLSNLLPDLKAEELARFFNNDFTAVIYTNDDGSWPSYIVKLKSDAPQAELGSIINKFENSPSLSKLFLTNPGTASGEFKNGVIEGLPARYQLYPNKKGAAIEHLIVGLDTFILTTNYEAAKETLMRLIK